MKRFILFFLGMAIFACQSPSEQILQLNIEVQGLKKGVLYLQRVDSLNQLQTIDSASANGNGKFLFTTNLPNPEMLSLYLKKEGASKNLNRFFFFAQPTKMNIITQNETFDLTYQISGSEEQKYWEQYSQMNQKFSKRNLDLLAQQIQAIKDKNISKADSLASASRQNQSRKVLYALNFALSHKDFHIAPYIGLEQGNYIQISYLDSLYNALPEKISTSKYGKELKTYIEKRKEQSE